MDGDPGAARVRRTGDLLRFGVASKTELRLAAPNYFGQSAAGSGFGDLAIGVKQQLGPTPRGFDVSVVLTLSMPTGASAVSSHGHDPSVQFAMDARAECELDGRGYAVGVLADTGWLAELDRRNHVSDRPPTHKGVGRLCRIRRRFSGARRGQASS